jgi:hypothetical protein
MSSIYGDLRGAFLHGQATEEVIIKNKFCPSYGARRCHHAYRDAQ